MSDKPADSSLKINLCESRGETSTFIAAKILENGDFQLSGQDVGKLPQEQFGSDYEYWLTVPKEQKDRLLLALLDQLYHGDSSAGAKLKEVLQAKSIPHKFDNYM